MKIILLAAVTLDGKIARNQTHFVDWVSREDRQRFISITKEAGVIIMGHNTFATLPAPLKGRLHIVMSTKPNEKRSIPGIVEFTNLAPEELLNRLEERGYVEAVLIGGAQVNTLFLRCEKVNEVWLTIEPRIFGAGLSLFEEVALDVRVKLLEIEQLNAEGTVLLKYQVQYEPVSSHSVATT
jgi:dihydrofolate reductase